MPRLVPGGAPEITVDRGRREHTGLHRMLRGTSWWLHPDGRLLVVPAAGLARDDLFPLPGRHRRAADVIEVRAGRSRTDGAATAGLIGRITPHGKTFQLTATYDIQTLVGNDRVTIRQPLVPEGTAGAVRFPEVDGITVPAVYRGHLTGVTGPVAGGPTDRVDFGPRPVTVTLLPAADADPVEVTVHSDDGSLVGDLIWLTAPGSRLGEAIVDHRVELTAGELRCELWAPDGSMSVTWTAPVTLPPGLHLGWDPPPLPVAATWARLVLRRTGDELDGEITIEGTQGPDALDYHATLYGLRAVDRTDDPDSAFEQAWRPPTPGHPGG